MYVVAAQHAAHARFHGTLIVSDESLLDETQETHKNGTIVFKTREIAVSARWG